MQTERPRRSWKSGDDKGFMKMNNSSTNRGEANKLMKSVKSSGKDYRMVSVDVGRLDFQDSNMVESMSHDIKRRKPGLIIGGHVAR